MTLLRSQQMVTVYCNEITSRVSFTFNLIFNRILGVEVSVISDQQNFENVNGPKFVYGDNADDGVLNLKPFGLLSSEGINEQSLFVEEYEGTPCFFGVEVPSAMPFDPFSASFYLVSRYEEYLPHMKDSKGRFEASQSVAFQNGFLRKPIVQIWALKIAKIIKSRFSEFNYFPPDFSFINTIDIDNAFAYKGKGLWRSLGGMAKDVVTFKANEFFMRLSVLVFGADDPYDTYKMMGQLAKESKVETICFLLQGNYGKYDKNLKHTNHHQISTIKNLAEFSDIGIHPSFASNKNHKLLAAEKRRLEDIVQLSITKSRQHYLIMSFPETYQHLIENGITDDYSMGYVGEPGFRAGISIPFPFYNLLDEKETALMVHPFAFMDRGLKDYLNLSPLEAKEIINEVMLEVKALGGQLCSVWHNESLNEKGEWYGWLAVYRYLVATS